MFAFAALLGACGPSHPAAHPARGALDRVAWLHAHWRAEEDGNVVDEIWAPTSESAWIGFNRTSTNGVTGHHELLRMEAITVGIRYVAAPAGQNMTAFLLSAASETHARFENPLHDFPTWIAYERAPDTLVATIGGADSSEPAATWRFRRQGDSPPPLDLEATLCREGSRLEITLAPCHCAAELFCAGFPIEGGVDVHVSLLEGTCAACVEARGSCALLGGPVVRVNGRPLEVAQGCSERTVPVLMISE